MVFSLFCNAYIASKNSQLLVVDLKYDIYLVMHSIMFCTKSRFSETCVV
jgi:hypothetical protein